MPALADPDRQHAAESRVRRASAALLLAMAAWYREHGRSEAYRQVQADVAAAGMDAGRALRAEGYAAVLALVAASVARRERIGAWQATEAPRAWVARAMAQAEREMDRYIAEAVAGRADALEASMGRWAWWIDLSVGQLQGAVVRETQVAAGVEEAVWVCRDDRRTRPAHHALDGLRFRWDGDPPLGAGESSSGQACWPGDDYNCRCRAKPISTRRRRTRLGM